MPPASGPGERGRGRRNSLLRVLNSVGGIPAQHLCLRMGEVFKKTILAKMLMDSRNLVSDLISREFADLAGLQYEPERKKVGTAAKGGA